MLATLATMPFDLRLTHWLRRPSLQQSSELSNTATAFRHLGDPGTIIFGAAAYGAGLLTQNRTVADVGLHTTGAIVASAAVAAVLASESRHRWPKRARIIAPLVYGAASLVALSRIYNNKHWASDGMLGAGVGIVSGYSVVRFQHQHPDNWIDRSLLPSRHAIAILPRFPGRPGEAPGVELTLRF